MKQHLQKIQKAFISLGKLLSLKMLFGKRAFLRRAFCQRKKKIEDIRAILAKQNFPNIVLYCIVLYLFHPLRRYLEALKKSDVTLSLLKLEKTQLELCQLQKAETIYSVNLMQCIWSLLARSLVHSKYPSDLVNQPLFRANIIVP